MGALLILVTMLVPCISFYDEFLEHLYNTRCSHSNMEECLTAFTSRKPALFQSSEFIGYPYLWLRSQTNRKRVSKKKKDKTKPQKYRTVEPKSPNLNMTFFPIILNKQIQATKINETTYPWIARVFHSPNGSRPYLCSAACIEERIFLTAARCITNGKIKVMNVLYQDTRLNPIALVVPSKPTKQMFDDIGFIVVDGTFKGKWQTIGVYDKFNRTDDNFKWFGKVPIFQGTAIGHVPDVASPDIQSLYEIKVHISNYLCNDFYDRTDGNSYFVPCYHTCTLEQSARYEADCKKYLGGEGHIIINAEKNKQLVGVATWGLGFHKASWHAYQMPVGMAVPNSDSFSEDLKCARKIKNASASRKSFANLC